MRNHGVSRIHRPSTDHRSVFDLGLINERTPGRTLNRFSVALNPLLVLGQQFGPLVLRNLHSLELHRSRMWGFAPRSSRHSIARCGAVASWGLVVSRGNLALVEQPHPSGSLPMRWPVSCCDFARAVERCLPPHRCARRWLKGWIASPLAGVRPSLVGQIVALSGKERVYARHQWCRRLDMASDQSGVGVSGLWWVSDILRGMSLDRLVAQVGQVLGDDRGLYGAAPQGGGWDRVVERTTLAGDSSGPGRLRADEIGQAGEGRRPGCGGGSGRWNHPNPRRSACPRARRAGRATPTAGAGRYRRG